MLFHLKATPYDIYQPGFLILNLITRQEQSPLRSVSVAPISHSTDWSWRRGSSENCLNRGWSIWSISPFSDQISWTFHNLHWWATRTAATNNQWYIGMALKRRPNPTRPIQNHPCSERPWYRNRPDWRNLYFSFYLAFEFYIKETMHYK